MQPSLVSYTGNWQHGYRCCSIRKQKQTWFQLFSGHHQDSLQGTAQTRLTADRSFLGHPLNTMKKSIKLMPKAGLQPQAEQSEGMAGDMAGSSQIPGHCTLAPVSSHPCPRTARLHFGLCR